MFKIRMVLRIPSQCTGVIGDGENIVHKHLFCSILILLIRISFMLPPHTEMPYDKWELNKLKYNNQSTLEEHKCLTLDNKPIAPFLNARLCELSNLTYYQVALLDIKFLLIRTAWSDLVM